MNAFAGTGRMVSAQWRTGGLALVLWTAIMTALVIATSAGVVALYPSPESRELYAATMGASPASMAFNGRWEDVTTLGGLPPMRSASWAC